MVLKKITDKLQASANTSQDTTKADTQETKSKTSPRAQSQQRQAKSAGGGSAAAKNDEKTQKIPAAARNSQKSSNDEQEQRRPIIGLALGAGGGRGWAHLGVLRALIRHGLEPDVIVGTSIGSLVGGAYLSGKLDILEDWATSLNRLRIVGYLDFKVRSGGLIGGNRINALMRQHFKGIMIEDLDRPYAAIATDMVTGHEIWLRKGKLLKAMQASIALPGIFPPQLISERWLIDGALVNPVPVSPLVALGAQMTIAVNLNQDVIGKVIGPGEKVPRAAGFDLFDPEFSEQTASSGANFNALARRVFRREPDKPSMFGVMAAALNITQSRLSRSRLAGDPPDVMIAPRIGHVGPLEFDRAEELIAEGEASVMRALPDLHDAITVLSASLPLNSSGNDLIAE